MTEKSNTSSISSQVSSLLIIDRFFIIYLFLHLELNLLILILKIQQLREVDLYSVFLTPLTYEGLIDEVLHIENGRIKLDSALVEEKDQVN